MMVDRALSILAGTVYPSDTELLRTALVNTRTALRVLLPEQLLSALVQADLCDCVLIRVGANVTADLQIIPELKHTCPGVPVLAYGDQWHVAGVVQAIKIGADEVCEFPGDSHQLVHSIKHLLTSSSGAPAEYADLIPKSILQKLSSEEARILHLLVQGRTTKEVGATLDVSIRTVHYRKKEMLRKLGVQNRSEAIELIRLTTGNLFGGLTPSEI